MQFKNKDLEEAIAIENQRDSISTYGWIVLIGWVDSCTIPKLAELSAKGFAYINNAVRKVKKENSGFISVDVDESVELLRSLKHLVADIQEVNEEDSLIMYLPNTDTHVNVMAFTEFLTKFDGPPTVISMLYAIQPLMAATVEADTLADFKEVYDWLEDFRIVLCQI